MKMLIALGLFLATSAHAFVPKSIHCKEVNSGIDNGYEAIFSQTMTKVSISEQTIAGPQHLTTLQCAADDVIINCSEEGKADTGYSFQMYVNDKGERVATLGEVSIAGTKKIADLVCTRLNPTR